ncbi:RluA family pseudouridine synthase [Chakrabartyella piscis]|uniref:RluA family pseudouridine synthase n=1 Tax=Chakrabartyella piscis TaxID=2918914 RepID=UPI0029585AB9|nr:RluA family pseudouridine synthase [Chakrabartyella piscis]
MDLRVIYEDIEMIAVSKPQGMPTQPDKTGDMDLLTEVTNHCGTEVFLLHRLDRPVGGILLFAKTKKSAGNLAKQMESGQIEKKYRVVLCGYLPDKKGTLVHYLKKNMRTNLSEVVAEGTKGAKKAILHYEVLEEGKQGDMELTLAEITLETGRHHQIRVQMAKVGTPIYGDQKYNKKLRVRGNIALHSYSLSGKHPITKKPWRFVDLPDWKSFGFK